MDSLEEVFEASKAAMTLYGSFFKDVAQEIGLERALALHAKNGKGFAALLAAATRARLAGRELNLSMLGAADRALAAQNFGMAPEVAESPDCLRMKWKECAFYEGLAAAGIDHKTIERMCRALTEAEAAALREEFPKLSVQVEFRATPEDACVEDFALTK